MKKMLLLVSVIGCAVAVCAAESDCCHHRCGAAGTADATATAAGPTDRSLYQLDSSWTNDTGAAVQLKSLRGRPQIVAMFFANCTYACPLIVNQMKQMEAALPAAARKNVGFTLVSFDSERDTPEALHQYRAAHELENKRWTLLRGSPDEVLELAALLNVKFKKDAQGQFLHSNVITLLNAKGEMVYQQLGLNADSAEMIRRTSELAQK